VVLAGWENRCAGDTSVAVVVHNCGKVSFRKVAFFDRVAWCPEAIQTYRQFYPILHSGEIVGVFDVRHSRGPLCYKGCRSV
jgi:hypothetical protein